jgi:hypothetical protein
LERQARLEDKADDGIDAGTYFLNNKDGLYTGDYENADDTANRIQKAGFLFELPALAADEGVYSATFKIYRSSDTPPNVNCALWHCPGVNRVTFENSDFEAEGTLIDPNFATPGGDVKVFYTCDVTSAVQYDYDNDGDLQVSMLRLDPTGLPYPSGANGNETSERYLWYTPTSKDQEATLELDIRSLCLPYLDADFNTDCYVDYKDLALLAQEWLQCTNLDDPNCM